LYTLQRFVNLLRRIFPRGWSPVIRFLARIVSGLRHYKVNLLNGDQMYLDLSENMCHGIFYYSGQPHEYGTERLLRSILRNGEVAVDVGANIGYYTRIISHLVGDTGTVLAFEPFPAAYKLLQLNCSDLPNTKLFPIALSNAEGETDFYIRKNGDMSSLDPGSHVKTLSVKTSTADSMLAAYPHIDFIKIDVEGFELEVIRGSRSILETHRPILYFEYIQSYANGRCFNVQDFQSLLCEYGYILKWIDHYSKEAFISDTPSNYIVALPNHRLDLLQ
jgi:FkbM family methyltransferase